MSGKRMKRALPAVLVLAVSVLTAVGLWASRPRVDTAPFTDPAIPVEVMETVLHDKQVTIPAMGTVIPARELALTPEVSGLVTYVRPALIPGGYIGKGDIVIKIDDRDYRAYVTQAEARVQDAETALELERGRQDVAQQEWELMQSSVKSSSEDQRLALRGPQLASAEAAVKSARSLLDQARLNLSRTIIRAPFNAVVTGKSVEIGQMVSPQTILARFAGADHYWVQVSLPVHQVNWITLPGSEQDKGSPVVIRHATGSGVNAAGTRTGHVISIYSDVSPTGRMARLLVEVDDPLGINSSPQALPLLLNAMVNVEIEGPLLRDAVVLPRMTVRDGNRVWLVSDDNRLVLKPIAITLPLDNEVVIQSGLTPGDRIVTSAIAAPVEGMLLRIVGGTEQQEVAPVETMVGDENDSLEAIEENAEAQS